MTNVTNIWAGENCIPEPATIGLLGFGTLSLFCKKKIGFYNKGWLESNRVRDDSAILF